MGLAGHGLLLATRFTYPRARISLQTFKAAALPCSSGCGVLACVSVPETSSLMRSRGAGGIAGLGRDRPSSGELGRQEPSCLALPSSAAVSRCCCLAKAVANNRAFTWKGGGVKLSSPSAARVPSPPLCLADVCCGHLLSRLRLLLRGVGRAAPLRGQLAAPGQHPGGHLPAALPAGGGAR